MTASWMHAFIDVPGEHVAEAQSFWSAVLGWPVGDPWPGNPEFASLVPADGAPYVHVQRIDGPPRVHLDVIGDVESDGEQARAHLDLGTDDMDAELERVQSLGARVLWPGHGFVALQDPLGLPFCVTRNDPAR